jgi:hypothetical protein
MTSESASGGRTGRGCPVRTEEAEGSIVDEDEQQLVVMTTRHGGVCADRVMGCK